MNSRQRMIRALNHEPVDRLPVDLGGTRQSGISVFAYQLLLDALGFENTPCVFDVYQMLAKIDDAVAQRFGSDTVLLNRPATAFGLSNARYKPFDLRGMKVMVPEAFDPIDDGQGGWQLQRDGKVIALMPANSVYFDRLEAYPGALHPDLETWQAPQVASTDWDTYATQSKRLYEETDKAIIVAMGPPYELFNGIGQGDFESWMITFATEDAYVDQLYTLLVDRWIENLQKLHDAVGDRVTVLQIADDLGTQFAPFLSTPMFREKLLPHYKRGLDWVHANTDWFVLMHTDGAIVPLLDSLIEMGVDAINPVQTTASGMQPDILKQRFGDRLVFWGGSCDCQGTLTNGSPGDVTSEVQSNLDTFKPLDGGFVYTSVHNIQANVPPANIIALYDAAMHYSPKEPLCQSFRTI